MKLSFFSIFFLITVGILSCKKDKNEVETETLEVTLKVNEDYEYDLGGFGDEEGATIEKQSKNFAVSELKRLNAVGIVYYYKPKLNFIGSDEVILRSERGSDGASPNTEYLYTTIKFQIKE